jgi:hypothetical protein
LVPHEIEHSSIISPEDRLFAALSIKYTINPGTEHRSSYSYYHTQEGSLIVAFPFPFCPASLVRAASDLVLNTFCSNRAFSLSVDFIRLLRSEMVHLVLIVVVVDDDDDRCSMLRIHCHDGW